MEFIEKELQTLDIETLMDFQKWLQALTMIARAGQNKAE